MGDFFCLFCLLTNTDFCDKMGGPRTPNADRIHHYTTPRQFCQEKSRTKIKKIFSRNLVILSIATRGQSAIIDNVKRGNPWATGRCGATVGSSNRPFTYYVKVSSERNARDKRKNSRIFSWKPLDKSQQVCYNRKCQEGVAHEIRGRATLRKYRK